MTDLELLQHTLKLASDRHADNVAWLEQGATHDHSQLELERAARDSEASLAQAKRDLDAYLACPVCSNHGALLFQCQPYGGFMCYCHDCTDMDADENGIYYTGTFGHGSTESEAFEDYYEKSDL
jgi:hypothetical protein